MTQPQTNWAGNHTYAAARWRQPVTLADVQAVVKRCRKLRVLGTRHSFNDIADTTEDLVSLAHFEGPVSVDRQRHTVTVPGNLRYGDLGRQLHREGLALHNLASLPHISVAGAIATATHGSGDGNGGLATMVSALELVTAGGERVTLAREHDGERFQGAVVSLGGLGVVTQVTLDTQPAFTMRQDLYENLSLAQLEAHFDAITGSAYSVSLFTDWRAPRFNQVWQKRLVADGQPFEPAPEFFGATRATHPHHPIGSQSPIKSTEQMGVAGPWHERLPHFRLEFTPSSGQELQTEYFVPRPHALAALRAIAGLRDRIAPLLQISEVRTLAADEFWMSPCYRQACVALHFTWLPDWPAVSRLLPLIEEQLAPFQARPHWGKLFTMRPEQLQAHYPRLPDFRQLLREFDPEGKFRNTYLDRNIFGGE